MPGSSVSLLITSWEQVMFPSFCLFNRDPEDRLLADVPLRVCVAAAPHTATEVSAHIHVGLDTA